ncbi:hypothetical protein RBG61_03005 [Paludicola sp. MB14-C6]|uniref:hypothetical protein n=1 Tax=Paludihabitans sp. MB14-C6 TaxID=3070656 RepID=UPI0027DCCB24|nr:hypothetical protein [Paludicola sp. MB14-C6]WMJ23651.1 hypothetical protein RBG61_03005 [Paludicola sp. MB14-C6]
MKKYSVLFYPILSIGLIYGILALITYFNHMQKMTFEGGYLLASLILYALIGVILATEAFFMKLKISNAKWYVIIERIILIILLLFFTYYPFYVFNPTVFALLIGYEIALIVLSLLKRETYHSKSRVMNETDKPIIL